MSEQAKLDGARSANEGSRREPGVLTFIALVSITLIGPLSIHLFLPAIPFVRAAFTADAALAQLAFSIAMLAMSTATLFYGSLSDRFGRLPVVVGGIGLFSIGAAVAALAPTIEILIAGRVLQGLGAACGMVMARAIARDLYGADRLGQMIAYITAAYVVGPMFSPLIAGFLIDAFGWQSILILPAVFGALAITIAITVIGETKPRDLLPQSGLLRGYRQLLTTPRFLLFALNPGFGTAGFFSLNSGSAYLMVETMGRPASEYGVYFMFGAVGYLTGNFLSGRLSKVLSGAALIVTGSLVTLGGGVLLAVLLTTVGLHPLCLFIPSSLLSLGQGLSMPQAQANAIRTEPTLTGTASGIVVFLQFFLGAVFSQLAGMSTAGSAGPLIAVVLTTTMLAAATGIAGVILTLRTGGRV
ncbi:MAG: hypothetical protein RLZ98_1901 [Pseudomonadota bacterium]